MVASPSFADLSPEEYLAQEDRSSIKHEYIRGYVYAMAGASDIHVTIALNMASALRSHPRGGGCLPYISDMKVWIETAKIFYYPDVMVTCDERDRELRNFKQYPCLIVEVLSDSTEGLDRGDKFSDYQELETLQEYVLISQKRQRVECFRRNPEGLWVLYTYHQGMSVHLSSVDLTIPIDAIYEDVIFI